MSGVDIVYTLIQDGLKRADRQQEVWRRIHRSILKHHGMDQWKRDLIEQIYQFDVPNSAAANQQVQAGINGLFMNWVQSPVYALNIQEINLEVLTRFRKMNYIRKWQQISPYGTAILDPVTGQLGTVQGGDLTERASDTLFDGYGYDVQDVYYRSGNVININSSTPLSKVFIGYFSNPKVNLGCTTDEEFQAVDSWIVNDYPGVIVADVLKYMFVTIGKTEIEAKGAGVEYTEELARLIANEVRVGTS